MLSSVPELFYDFHFLPVGEKSKPGDATCFRYGEKIGNTKLYQTVCVIDAGTQKTGSEISSLIQDKYGTNVIDFAFLTHPHDDHIQGFFKIIDECKVKNLIIHKPWTYSNQVLKIIGDGRRTKNSIKNKLQSVMDTLYSLYEKAKSKNITIIDAIHDQHLLPREIKILGPNLDDYISLLPRILIEKN